MYLPSPAPVLPRGQRHGLRQRAGAVQGQHRRRAVVVHSRLSPDSLLMSALDKVLNQITRIIYDHETKRRKLKASGEPLEVEVQGPGKKVKFSTSSSSERLVKEPVPGCSASGRGLSEYLSLPLTEYALLDPRWITRPDPEGAPDVFVLRVPLSELLHVALQPQVTIRVNIDTANCKVKFYATDFKVGDVRFDQSFALDMDATLSHKPVKDVTLGANIAAAWRSWGQNLAVATGTASEPARAGLSRSGSWSSLASADDLASPVAPAAPVQPATPVMISLPRSMQARTTPPAYITPTIEPDTTPSSPVASTPSLTDKAMPLREATHSPTAEVVYAEVTSSSITNGTSSSSAQPLTSTSVTVSTETREQQADSIVQITNSITSTSTTTSGLADTTTTTATSSSSTSQTSLVATSSSTTQDEDRAGPSAPPAADAGVLRCSVDLRFDVTMPPPLSVVPGPMLALAGGLLSRFAVRAMLPGFLELLSVDYSRWASGSGSRSQAAGSLTGAAPPQQQDQQQQQDPQQQQQHDQEQDYHPQPIQGETVAATAQGAAGHEGLNGHGHPDRQGPNGNGSHSANGKGLQGLLDASHEAHDQANGGGKSESAAHERGPLPSLAGARLESVAVGVAAAVSVASEAAPPS